MADENLEQKQDSTLNEDAPQSASSSALAANTAAGASAAEDAGDEAGASATAGTDAAAADTSAGTAGKARVVGIAACMLAALALCAVTVAYALGAFGHDDGAASVAEVATASGEEAGGDASAAAGAEASLASEASGEASGADAVASDEAPASENVSDGAAAADAGGGASTGESPAPEAPSAGADAPQGGGQQTEPAPAPQPATVTVSVYIDSSRAATVNGRYPSCMASTTVTLSQGATVYDALCATGVGVSGSSYYVSAINGLAEKLSGYPNSGWMYSVNGVFPQYACGRYVLQGGENIRWAYTLDLGKDL